MTQQGDVLLYQGNDDGEIDVVNGVVTMSGGLETAAYLSLFGGNEQDDGRSDSPLQYWGNYGETPDRQYRSETQYLLRSIPAIPANLRRLEDAATRDLGWFVSSGAATSVSASATMPGPGRIRLVVSIDEEVIGDYIENWKADV